MFNLRITLLEVIEVVVPVVVVVWASWILIMEWEYGREMEESSERRLVIWLLI